jgi:hypothetical protein
VYLPEEIIYLHMVLGVPVVLRETCQAPLTSRCSAVRIDAEELDGLTLMGWFGAPHLLPDPLRTLRALRWK